MKKSHTACREAILHKGNKVFHSLLIFVMLLCTASMHSMLFSQPLATGHDKFLGSVHGGGSSAATAWDNYWNQVTPENASKWASVEGARDVYNWGGADNAYNYAKQRGIPFKWHTLIWGQQSPGWISALPDAEKLEEIVEWISGVGQRYPEIDLIDVVNEALNGHNPPDGGGGRVNFKAALGGNGTTGWDWVIKSFELARQYIPHAKLVLNDYGIINDNNATTSYLTIINLLKQRGLIDGIGVQGHRFELMNASNTTLKGNMDRLWATGIPIYISELDLGPSDTEQPNETLQLTAYQRIFPLLWEHPGLKGITLWGYVQGQMWQPNCYLLRSNGTETPALQWLRNYLSSGQTRTTKSGNWNDISIWETHNDTAWVAASSVPSVNNNSIIISANDTVTVTASDSIDQLSVSSGGKLVVNAGVSFKIKNGGGTDLTVTGTIENSGVISQDDSTEIKFTGGGKYVHKRDGGSIPIASFEGSTIQFDSIKTILPSNIKQNFYHVVWNCPSQTSDLTFGWDGNTIGGNITIMNTGSAQLLLCEPEAGDTATVTIMGNVVQSGGEFSANGTSNANTTITINHFGSVNVTGGNFSISRGTQGGTGTTVWNVKGSSFSISNATTQNFNPTGAKFRFAGAGEQTLTLGSGNTLTALPIEVAGGATLSLGTSTVIGSGMFAVDSGATLACGHAGGIDSALQVSGSVALSKHSGYIFNGSAAQVTGNLLPDTVGNLTVNNTAGVTLSHSVAVNGTLELQKGALSLGSNTFHYGPEATLKYSDRSLQTTTDVELPSGGEPKNLVITNTAGVTLHGSRTFKGSIHVGGKLRLGSNTLTAASATNTGTGRFIAVETGMLKLTGVGSTEASLFPVGTTLYAPVWITNAGTADTIGVSVEADAGAAAFGGRVNVKWKISEGTEGGGNYILRLGWVSTLENTAFRTPDRAHNAHIFYLSPDTSEAGVFHEAPQFTTSPYYISRESITTLGTFAVGRFKDVPDGVERTDDIPGAFSLEQNYPNPFNPTTTIKFSLPVRSEVRLSVISMLGQVVRDIAMGTYEAGVHQVTMSGANLASGVYFYRLVTNTGFIQTKRFLLLK